MTSDSPTVKGRSARIAIALASGVLGLALLMPASALAWPAGMIAITGQPRENHPTFTWCKLPRVQSLFVETATSDEVGVGGHFLQKNLLSFNVVGKQVTSFTDEYEYQPGTYYVHVGTDDPGVKHPDTPDVEYSNVLSFQVLPGPHVVGTTAPCPPPPSDGGGGGVADKKAPVLSLSFPRVQHIDKLYVKVRTSEAATIKVSGTVSVRGASKVFRFKPKRLDLPGNASTKVPLKLAKKSLRAVKRALAHRKLKAKITISATDAAGNRSAKKATLRVKK
jgi:hypothetical protein